MDDKGKDIITPEGELVIEIPSIRQKKEKC